MERCFIYIYYRPCWTSPHCWIPFLMTMCARLRFWNSQVHIQSQGRIQSANAIMTSEDLIWCDIFVNCKWIATRRQLYNTHLHTNNTQSDTKQTIHRTAQNLRTIQTFWKSAGRAMDKPPPFCCSGKSVYCFVRKFSSSRWYSDMLTIVWIILRFIKFKPGILCLVILHNVLVAVVFHPANTVYWRLWTAVTKRACGCIFCWVF